MLRLLIRLMGFILLACGFIALIVDGTRSIAGGRVLVTSLRRGLFEVFPTFYQGLQNSVAGVSAFLWDPLLTSLMILPVSLVLGGIGAGLILMSHKRAAPIGYVAR